MDPRLQLAIDAAREAGRVTLKYFRRPGTGFERKADSSPVTVADREAETLLREMIAARFPHDGILGEEFPEREGTSGYRWVLDPIDGTKSFISGVPLYATLIGIERDGEVGMGVIRIPALDEMVYAERGAGAWHVCGPGTPQPARVDDRRGLQDGLFVTSQVDTFARRQPPAMPVYESLQQRAYITRTWGDAYGYLLVATGRAAVMVDPVLNPWDAAAVKPVLEEAGGLFVDWQGRATIHSGEGIGTHQAVLDEILPITSPWADRPVV